MMERGNGVGFCTGPRFVNIDHDTALLLPPNLRDWVPSDHLSHFILDAVAELKVLQVGQITQECAGVSEIHAAWIRDSDAGVDPGKHGLQSEKTASDGGDGLKSKRSGMS